MDMVQKVKSWALMKSNGESNMGKLYVKTQLQILKPAMDHRSGDNLGEFFEGSCSRTSWLTFTYVVYSDWTWRNDHNIWFASNTSPEDLLLCSRIKHHAFCDYLHSLHMHLWLLSNPVNCQWLWMLNFKLIAWLWYDRCTLINWVDLMV